MNLHLRAAAGPLWRLVLVAALCVWSGASQAANIVHFQPAAGPHNYIVTDHPAVLEHLTPSVWLLGSYGKDPLVFRDADGQVLQKVVEHAVSADAAFAIGLFDRFELGLGAPLVYVNGPGFDGGGLSAAALGDLRLLGKVLLTPWNEGLVASFRVRADMPFAQLLPDAGRFAGETTWPNLTPALSAGYNSRWFRLGLDLGYLVRAPAELGDLRIGHEIVYGLGAEAMVVEQTLYGTFDLFGRAAPAALSTVMGTDPAQARDHFPLEAVGGIKYFLGPVMLTAGGGTGIIPDYGAPLFRLFVGIGFYPRPERDRDGDGIVDREDRCPDDPETKNGYQDEDGCPDALPTEPGDRDGDGILDPDDACPDAPEDKDGFEDEDGCPDVDNDKDGIIDDDDKCPLEPEDRDRWEDADGCPDPDNDGDKILDEPDECPNDPETYNGNQDEDGCPDGEKVTVVVKREQVEILDTVHFEHDSDRILERSFGLLDRVAKVINEHQEIPRISVEGHTDWTGSDAYNLDLSRRRAASVKRYLIKAGVEASRLGSQGFGERRPIATNNTAEGRAKNRRVEFRIVDQEGAEAAPDLRREQPAESLPAGDEDAPAEGEE